MDLIELEEIQAYFKIDDRIAKIESRIKELRYAFYERTMTTRTESDGLEVYSVGFRMEPHLFPYLDTILAREKTIEVLKKRKRYLIDYLNTLDPLDKEYLIQRYTKENLPKTVNPSDVNLYEEILEINEAINFMYGYPPDIRNIEVNNDTLEDDFERMLEALEV